MSKVQQEEKSAASAPAPAKKKKKKKKKARTAQRVRDEEGNEMILFKPKPLPGEPQDELPEERWSVEHAKLLYIVSKYAKCAESPTDREGWIRELPLRIIMFEAIRQGCIDYDYAPCSVCVCPEGTTIRIWMNITQDGKAAMDDLRESKLVNGLKLSTEDFQPVTAYQVSLKGLQLLEVMGDDLQEMADKVLFNPPDQQDDKHLMQVEFDGATSTFMIRNEAGNTNRASEVTETEDVSYVSSPYLPQCIRADPEAHPLTSNAHRASEAAAGGNNIEDELSEAIVLSQVHSMVAEWIPFGSNQIVSLNDRLGALDRCPGGFFTNKVDTQPENTQFTVEPGLTKVKILDFDYVRFTNFEAEINFPDDDAGIVQVENFGMHLNVDGSIIYGVFIEAVIDRLADDISLDHLSRVLVDIHIDSSKIMNDLLSPYQRDLLMLIYAGDLINRNKYNMVIADALKPKLPAEKYMDKGEFENELKQVLGDLYYSHDLGEHDVLLLGKDGALLAGPHAVDNEPMLIMYLGLLSREMFIRNFFVRTFVLDKDIDEVQRVINNYTIDPHAVTFIRERTSLLTRQNIMLHEILKYLNESLDQMVKVLPNLDTIDSLEAPARMLLQALQINQMHSDVMLRVTDLAKLGKSATAKIEILQFHGKSITEAQLGKIVRKIDSNYQALVTASQAEQRASVSVAVMEIIFSGGFAFNLIDRITGDPILGNEGSDLDGMDWATWFTGAIIIHPYLFFILNMLWLFTFCYALKRMMAYLQSQTAGATSLKIVVNKAIDVAQMENFTKNVISCSDMNSSLDSGIVSKVAIWEEEDGEEWGGATPTISMKWELQTVEGREQGFLLTAMLQWNKNHTTLSDRGVLNTFHMKMVKNGVYARPNKAVQNVYTPAVSEASDA